MSRARAAVVVMALTAACRDQTTGIGERRPLISAASVAANPTNVLSATVSVHATDAATASVRVHRAGQSATDDDETPAVTFFNGEVIVPVFGLLPEEPYVFRAVAHGSGGDVISPVLELTTGALPSDIPVYTAGGADPTPGYVAFSVGAYGVAIDNSGRVVWYHRFGAAPFLNFQPQRTGRYVAGASAAAPGGPFTEIDPLGTITRTLGCTNGALPRFHDLRAELDGSYWLMCDETRTMDLTAVGGVASARVTGTLVQHVSGTGERLFQWSAFDHFAITDVEESARAGSVVNWTHGNAIDLDTDGNLLISFRALSELAKIDTRTGAVLWRMGGSRSDFAFAGTEGSGFARQHGLRMADRGTLTLLDNLGDPSSSRGERYEYDEQARTVRLTATYPPTHPAVALLGGTTQQLPRAHILVSYGSGGVVEEYDASGRIVWQIYGNAGYVFRATRIASLYAPVPY